MPGLGKKSGTHPSSLRRKSAWPPKLHALVQSLLTWFRSFMKGSVSPVTHSVEQGLTVAQGSEERAHLSETLV